jgi:NAD-dependent dihydropyrimidine dehydrogenase PreA subunit
VLVAHLLAMRSIVQPILPTIAQYPVLRRATIFRFKNKHHTGIIFDTCKQHQHTHTHTKQIYININTCCNCCFNVCGNVSIDFARETQLFMNTDKTMAQNAIAYTNAFPIDNSMWHELCLCRL